MVNLREKLKAIVRNINTQGFTKQFPEQVLRLSIMETCGVNQNTIRTYKEALLLFKVIKEIKEGMYEFTGYGETLK
jgi:hypothetical protein